MEYRDIWDGEWDDFQNDVIKLATTWIRLFYKRYDVKVFPDAFAMERVIEQIRVNARKSPPQPWSDGFNSVPIPRDSPFIERIHYSTPKNTRLFSDAITKGIYILRHPCIILLNLFSMYTWLTEETKNSWDIIGDQLESIFRTHHHAINTSYDTMTFEYKRKNEETGRYTSYSFSNPMDNTDRRARKLNARRKAINLTRERHNVKANERIATLNLEFEWTAQPSSPVEITTDNGIQPQVGVYGALVDDIRAVQMDLSQERRLFMLEETNYLR